MQRRAFLAGAGALAVAGCGGGGKSTTTSTTSGGERLPGSPDDPAVLAFILRLEQLQLDLYRRGEAATFFKPDEAALIKTLAEQEREHVAKLTGEIRRLKGRVPRPPALKLPIGDRRSFLGAAYRLENLTASTYLSQIARIRDSGVLELVVSIQTVEGRHAAAVGTLLGKTATPDGAFAQPHNMAAAALVLDEVAA